jgi:hypothetical protein
MMSARLLTVLLSKWPPFKFGAVSIAAATKAAGMNLFQPIPGVEFRYSWMTTGAVTQRMVDVCVNGWIYATKKRHPFRLRVIKLRAALH